MQQTINLSQFRDAFNRMDRGSQFSYEALELIYDYLEECDPDSELDVIAICCEFSEMSLNDVIDAYNINIDYEANIYSQVIDYISDHSIYCGDTPQGTLVFAQF
jgi:hypothetical protein